MQNICTELNKRNYDMKKELSTKVYYPLLSDIRNNWLNPGFWWTIWTLYVDSEFVITMSMNYINVQSRSIDYTFGLVIKQSV